MKLRSLSFISLFSLCSLLSWGQTWNLTSTMKAKLGDSGWLAIWTTAPSEAMPNFSRNKPAPWKSPHKNFGVRIVGNITSIGNYAFANCENLTVIEFISDKTSVVNGMTVSENSHSLKSIGDGAFEGCTKLGSGNSIFGVELPDSLKLIGNYAFRGCAGLKSIYIPKSVTSIGKYAFRDCSSLDYIDIPNSVKSIGNGAFQRAGLSFVRVNWEIPLNVPDSVFASVNTANVSLYLPKEAKSLYENANVWKSFNIQEDSGSTYEKDHPIESFLTNIKNFVNGKIGAKAFVLSILVLSIILFFMRIVKEKDEPRRGSAFVISNTLFLIVCILEILYYISFFNSPEDPTWFCSPSDVGWWWTIFNFLLFGGIVYNQILYFFDVMSDAFANGNTECDLRLGLYSYVGGFIGALLCSFFYHNGISFVFLVVGTLQIIQSVLIFRSYDKNTRGAFWAAFIYLLGSIGTVVTILTFLKVLIIVAVVVGILWAVLAGSGSKSSSSSDSSSSDATEETLPYAYCRECIYYPGHGYNCGHKRGSNVFTVYENSKACRNWQRT